MTASQHPAPPDQAARTRIVTDIDTTLLVEAGAGSGKTTSLVNRLVALVRDHQVPMSSIAAVTFTRKAAAELRERFQLALEQARLPQVAEMDRAFLGTIHAFAGRLLREFPVEAGLDPAFEEVDEFAWPLLVEKFWEQWLESLRVSDSTLLKELGAVGIAPKMLAKSFADYVKYPDVTFDGAAVQRPDHAALRTTLEALMEETERRAVSWANPDELTTTQRRLRFLRHATNWDDLAMFARSMVGLTESSATVVLKNWGITARSNAKPGPELDKRKEFDAFLGRWVTFITGPVADFRAHWYAHRYPIVLRFLDVGAKAFSAQRARDSMLGFEDLLQGAVLLLRDNARVRDRLGERFRRVLVDEFQDTDPIQAELCFLLASPSSEGTDWRTVRPRAGGLFVVGDPKQSIYRFRRADIQTYNFVKGRVDSVGAVLELSATFRSRPEVAGAINDVFGDVFPEIATAEQAARVPLQPYREAQNGDGAFSYAVRPAKRTKNAIIAADADIVARWIAAEVASGARVPGDFLILTYRRFGVAEHARALAAWRIPVETTNAELQQDAELRELVTLLQAIADPSNEVFAVAALEGRFFGCTPRDLWNEKLGLASAHVVVARAQLTAWQQLAAQVSADVLVDRILDDTGLLLLAASEVLGEARAGVLVRLVDMLRASDGGTGLDLYAALGRIEVALASEGFDVPLRPGKGGAVRVMNVHQAKGLEAHTVILAAPIKASVHEPRLHVRRAGDGPAHGWWHFLDEAKRTIARPRDWDDVRAVEEAFAQSEFERLRYVAATRAEHRLVIGVAELPAKKDGSIPADQGSPWGRLDELGRSLGGATATALQVPERAPLGRETLTKGAVALRAEAASAVSALRGRAEAGWGTRTVTERVKVKDDEGLSREELAVRREYDVTGNQPRGVEWGRVVHRSIEAMGRGRSGEGLARFVRAVVREEYAAASAEEQDTLVARALGVCEKLRTSDDWQKLGDALRFEVGVYVRREENGRVVVEEGVIDAVGVGAGAVTVLDWKTDVSGWEERLPQYQAQVNAYVEALGVVSGVKGQGEVVRV